MTIQSRGHEHEFEPQYGLPERLPAGERIIWQGAPDARLLALQAFHWGKLALYFALMLALGVAALLPTAGSAVELLMALRLPLLMVLTALTSVAVLAWLSARTTAYTLTDKRIVMRVGIVLTLTFNLPLKRIEAASLRAHTGGSGDIVLKLSGPDRIAWFQLWPHVRPWHVNQAEPMLRSLPDAVAVAALLSEAWSASNGDAATHAIATATAVGTDREPRTPAQPQWQSSPT
jgi:hypothetical protein